MTLSVLIVEDDPEFRQAFAHAVSLAADMHLAGIADDLPSGIVLLACEQPDVLLVDLGLPSGSGIELIRMAAQTLPACDVMVVTVFGDERHVLASIEAGATGYLLKDTMPAELVEQIRVLRAGGSPISPVIARQLLARFSGSTKPIPPAAHGDAEDPVLSEQECRVLTLSAKGYNYDEIATLIGVSRHTVLTYVKRSYRKLQGHSKTEAVYEARRLGLVDD